MLPSRAEELRVNLGPRSYSLHFAADLRVEVRAEVDARRAAGRPVAVVTDATVAAAQADAMRAMFDEVPRWDMRPGEGSKRMVVLEELLEFLARNRIDRTGTLFALGGGVVGDLAGFAAASYLRGIDFVQVPTTLLAMVDSSVGGKTGVNLAAGKNLVGAFHQPRGVFIATDLLGTLAPREFAAGAAEVLKYGLLGDAALWNRLSAAPLMPRSADLAAVIRRCCALKARIVEADERETAREGGRALLNLGHTFGHAIEAVTAYGTYLHGEAVAIGLVAAAELSQRLGLIKPPDVERVRAAVEAHALPVQLREPLSLEALTAAMGRDKKVRSGRLRFVVLRSLGEAITCDVVPAELAAESFRAVGAR